ncbi:hypothetical protein MBLNU457_5475t1 [Dothideomycetes sp. NU457]
MPGTTTTASAMLYDALILGAGPAGLSTALSLCRVKHTSAVFSTASFRNDPAYRAHTVLSRDDLPAAEIRRLGRLDIEKYDNAHFVERGAVSAKKTAVSSTDGNVSGFEVTDESGEVWRGRKLVLAMGSKDIYPDIPGYDECWGNTIYQCLFCDGRERSHMPAAILSFDHPMQLHYVSTMLQMGVPEIHILGNGPIDVQNEAIAQALESARALGCKVDERKIRRLTRIPGEGHEGEADVVFEDGNKLRVGFVAHRAATTVAAPEVVRGLGVEIVSDPFGNDLVKREEPFGKTNVDGVFACGDAGTMIKQLTFAMAHGAAAGAGVHFALSQERQAAAAEKIKGVEPAHVKQMGMPEILAK